MVTGICGADVRWNLDQGNGLMTVSGNGPMTDFFDEKETPWYELRDEIRELVFEEGVTTLGDYSFGGCKNLVKVTMPSTMEILGTYGLRECDALEEAVLPEGVRLIGAKVFSVCPGLKKVYMPLSLKAIDMKAFEKDTAIEEVVYAGTREDWKKIRVSMSATGNKYMLGAKFTYLGEDENGGVTTDGAVADDTVKEEVIPVYEMAKKIIKQGGDGRLHILAINLTKPNVPGKQGDCTILIFPDGKLMMIDAGVPYCEEMVMKAMRSLELTSLDYFVISHPHLDHVGNALAVAKYIYDQGGTIGTYFYMGYRLKELEPAFAEYLQQQGVTMDNHLREGDVRQIGDVQMEVYGPSADKTALSVSAEHVNSLSLMLKFSFGESSYLTCGDLYRRDELEAIEKYGSRLHVPVMKANHHGAYTSNCPEWIETVHPEVMIVQTDDIGATLLSERAIGMGIEYYTIGLNGSVLVTMDKDGTVEAKTSYGKTYYNKK